MGLIIGIIVLFIGMSVVSSTGNISKISFVYKSNNPPNVPSNPNPLNGSTNITICPVNFSWTGGDPDGDNVTYDIYFGKCGDNLTLIASNIMTTWFQDSQLLEFETCYIWKVVAWDEYGYKTEGPNWTFQTEENFPPYKPSQPYPEHGAVNTPLDVILCWIGGDPNLCDTVTYDVYFGPTSNPSLKEWDYTETCYDPPYELELYEDYYWRIVSRDSQGESTSGDEWVFTTDPPNPPNKPIITGPTSGKVGVEYKYNFSLSDPDGDAMYLRVDWENGTPGPWQGPYDSDTTVRLNHTWTKKGTYAIRAQAKDIYGIAGPWGTLEVTMPRNKATYYSLFLRFLERYPLLNRFLTLLIN